MLTKTAFVMTLMIVLVSMMIAVYVTVMELGVYLLILGLVL